MSVGAGGGVADFTGDAMREMTTTGGAWDARLVLGTHKYIGLEAGYVGSAQAIDAIGLDTDALLISNGADAAIRIHLLPGEIQPYVFAGAGWRRYDLTRVDTNTSSLSESDDVIEVPFGVGFTYGYEHLMFDVRGCYRPTFDNDLVPAATAGEDAPPLDTFQVTARVGWEF